MVPHNINSSHMAEYQREATVLLESILYAKVTNQIFTAALLWSIYIKINTTLYIQ